MSDEDWVQQRRTGPRLTVREIYALIVIAAVLLTLYAAREALPPYLLAFIFIYILLPIVHAIERILPNDGRWARARRPVAVLTSAIGAMLLAVVLLGILLAPVIERTSDLFENLDIYWDELQADYPGFVDWYESVVPEEIRVRINEHMDEFGQAMAAGAVSLLTWLLGVTGNVVGAVAALIIIPLFTIYYLLEEPHTARNLRRQLPERWAGDAIALFRIFDRVMGSYTRGVVLEAVIVGFITGAGYWLIGVELALPLGVIAFAGEVVPIVGPWIAFAISFPVVLATQPELAIPAVLVFVVVQGLEGWFLAPRIQGGSVEFTSAGTLVILAIGGALAGGIGVVFALPAAAMLRAVIVYLAHRLDGASPEDALARLPVFHPLGARSAPKPAIGDQHAEVAVQKTQPTTTDHRD